MQLKIALIGQSQFAVEVFQLLRSNGHTIVGVFTIPDINGKMDPIAQIAISNNVPVFKFSRWRNKGVVLQEVFEAYKSLNADLNVLPYCSQFIPMEIINYPSHKSIIYHPSILPKHRGASAINWTLIHGDEKAGFTIFWADDGLDTGPILLIKDCNVEINDTVDTLYNRFLYPEGIKALGEAVQLIANGKAPSIIQPEEGASYEPIMKKEIAELKGKLCSLEMHNFIRGCEPVPGAWVNIDEERVSLFGSTIWKGSKPKGQCLKLKNFENDAIIHDGGIYIPDEYGNAINIARVQLSCGRMMQASKFGKTEDSIDLNFTENELNMLKHFEDIWKQILSLSTITKDTDFFKSGGGSMQVVRLVEEVNSNYESIKLLNEDVYMATTFNDFFNMIVIKGRGGFQKKEFTYDAIEMNINKKTIKFPHQLFINNEFLDASDGKTFDTINPNDESVICRVALGSKKDVDTAVDAAHRAFYEGEWGKMNARDRGHLMFKLAALMAEHKEELSVIESLDSGAVYTLALKTHIGMSIDVFHYFAGWCDKIHGSTIPINNARPNKNLTLTKREPIGVCGIITPWNYPLMMLSWKMAACLAAGNTVILKPAMVTPLTSLKFCELVVKAGFPPGVINVIPGSGGTVGQAMTDHPKIRKLGFTGSTEVGKSIMESCAKSNLKKVSLELGGKSPLIIFNDCDFEKAVRMGCSAVFFNKGENCIAAGRLFVEEDIHDAYVQRVIEEVKKMKIGNPLDTSVDHGPCNHKAHFDYLLKYIKRGVDEGATLVYGGSKVDGPGLFIHPAIFTNVKDEMMLAKEESFGPIMIILKFKNGEIDEVLERANNTEFGLASGVFTKDICKALRCADKLAAGTVFVNTYNKTDVAAPFGGYKQSGFGKDLGEEALNEYLQTKSITIEY